MTPRARRFLQVVLVSLTLALPWTAEAVRWGWFGVRIRDLSEQEMEEISSRYGIREGYGAMIVEVISDAPAAQSGLKNGDLVVAFRERPVVDTRTLQRLVSSTPVGEEVSLTVLRPDQGRRPITIRVGAMPVSVAAERVAAEFGFTLRSPSRASGETAGLVSGEPPAVGVVLRGSQAERSGLLPGDVIVEINGHRLISSQAVSQALVDVPLDQPLRLVVRRGSEPLSLTLPGPSTP
jgi:serine protease Do